MLDYLILQLESPTCLQAEMTEWLAASACLGWECRDRDGVLDLRLYFSSGEVSRLKIEEMKRRFAGIHIRSETEIRLPETSDRPPDLKETLLVGENFRLLSGPAFGSGLHPTTRLVAALLQKNNLRGCRILDLGTGTGILALLAERLGAARIEAVEISSEARENAKANFLLNSPKDIPVYATLADARGPYDFILANLMTQTLLQLQVPMVERLAPQGQCLVSGVMSEESSALLNSYTHSFNLEDELAEEEWRGFRFSLKRPSENSF